VINQIMRAEGSLNDVFFPISVIHISTLVNLHVTLSFCLIQVDETGVEPKDIELVMQQANVSKAKVSIVRYKHLNRATSTVLKSDIFLLFN